MNGLIGKQMAADTAAGEQAEPAAEAQAAAMMPDGGGSKTALTITPQSVQEKLTLTPKQQTQLERIVAAGMKVMFSEKTRGIVRQELQKSKDIASVLGESVAGLMGILLKQSNNALPLDLLIPAGLVLLAHAAEMTEKISIPITDADVGDASEIFIHVVLHMNGMSGDKMADVIESGGVSGQAPAAPAAPSSGGLVAGEMEQPA